MNRIRGTRQAGGRWPMLLLLLPLLAGCGMFGGGDKAPVYVGSEEIPPLRVPPDLSAPEVESSFEIPGYSLPELAAQGDESMPPRVLSSAEAENARSRVRFGPLGLYLEVDDSAASVWRRLGFALNRGEMSVEDVRSDQRRYAVAFRHEPILVAERGWFSKIFLFWRSPEFIDYNGRYLFEVQRDSSNVTRVVILNEEGAVLPMQQAEFVLARLQERLG